MNEGMDKEMCMVLKDGAIDCVCIRKIDKQITKHLCTSTKIGGQSTDIVYSRSLFRLKNGYNFLNTRLILKFQRPADS